MAAGLTWCEGLGNSGSLGLLVLPGDPCAPFSPLVMAETPCVRRQPYVCACVCAGVMKCAWLWLLVCVRVTCHCAVRARGWKWMCWPRAAAVDARSSSCSSVTSLPPYAAIHAPLCSGMKPEGRAKSSTDTRTALTRTSWMQMSAQKWSK